MVPLIYTYISKPLSELSISTNFVMHYLQTLHPRLDSVLSLNCDAICFHFSDPDEQARQDALNELDKQWKDQFKS